MQNRLFPDERKPVKIPGVSKTGVRPWPSRAIWCRTGATLDEIGAAPVFMVLVSNRFSPWPTKIHAGAEPVPVTGLIKPVLHRFSFRPEKNPVQNRFDQPVLRRSMKIWTPVLPGLRGFVRLS